MVAADGGGLSVTNEQQGRTRRPSWLLLLLPWRSRADQIYSNQDDKWIRWSD
jgi:hypothetical protein